MIPGVLNPLPQSAGGVFPDSPRGPSSPVTESNWILFLLCISLPPFSFPTLDALSFSSWVSSTGQRSHPDQSLQRGGGLSENPSGN